MPVAATPYPAYIGHIVGPVSAAPPGKLQIRFGRLLEATQQLVSALHGGIQRLLRVFLPVHTLSSSSSTMVRICGMLPGADLW